MSESQGPGGGALEPHYNVGFGPPPSSKHYTTGVTHSLTSSSVNGLTDLSSPSHHHLTLLKNGSVALPPSWLPVEHHDLSSRLSDFSEMRYLELNNWDLNSSYPSDTLTARLVDSRSMDSNDQPINYRPWEKPTNGSQQQQQQQQQQTTSSGITQTTGTVTNTNGIKQEPPATPNGVSSTNDHEKSSPPTLTPLQNAFPNFTETFSATGQKLPSFQSQFNAFTEGSEQAAPSLPSFHTLPANRAYVPGHPAPPPQLHAPHPGHPQMLAASPMAHREQQPFLEERHIQLFPGQVPLPPGQFPLIATSNVSNGHHNAYVNTTQHGGFVGGGHHHHHHHHNNTTLQLQELVPVPPMILHHPVAVTSNSTTHKLAQQITTDGSIPGLNLNIIDPHHHGVSHGPHAFTQNGTHVPRHDGPIETHLIAVKLQNHAYEHNNIPMVVNANSNGQVHHQITKIEQRSPHVNGNTPHNGVVNGTNGTATPSTPTKRQGKRKRSENPGNNHVNGNNNSDAHQVSSVSSTDSDFKRPNMSNNHHGNSNGKMSNGMGHSSDGEGMDKPVKKKRKRCGECIGCQRKDNCGECAPCRNDKSHQICKQRRCDKLTEKKTPKSKLKQQAPQLH